MLPRWHIFWGAIFTLLIWIFIPEISLIYLAIIFLSTFLIDFDHYIVFVKRSKNLNLLKAFEYHKQQAKEVEKQKARGIREKGDFHIFHTLEFHLFIMILGIFWTPLFFVFIGMIFHSLLDIFYLLNKGYFYRREFFLVNWLRKN